MIVPAGGTETGNLGQSMTSPKTTAAIPIAHIEAQIFVRNLLASRDFYVHRLGFSEVFIYGEPPFYAAVRRGPAQINLRPIGEPVFVGDIRERESLLSATPTLATTRETAALFAEFKASGIAFHQELQRKPWGAVDFILRDPDGNLIHFAGPADE
jgi:catechol 2,3-dioxygenase-like lactoylglutathione lyase family enzyme